jgi:deoxyribodipyrimidine photo-lyase
MADPVLVWFRQDLRLADQAALAAAAKAGPVVALYVLDDETPGHWRIGGAQRWWLHHSLAALGKALADQGVQLVLRSGRVDAVVPAAAQEAGAVQIHALRHYEPWWIEAERAIAAKIDLVLHDGTRLLPPGDLRTGSGGRFRVFAPYWRALQREMPPPKPPAVPKLTGTETPLPSDDLERWRLLPNGPDWAGGFSVWQPGEAGAHAAMKRFTAARIEAYADERNLVSIHGTSGLSPHLHHGEISPAQLWHHCDRAGDKAEPFLRELAWRDFTANQMEQQPDVGDVNGRRAYDALPWRTAQSDLKAWQRGRTGYPLVDAGMRQLWHIGWLHNRARLVTSAFLIKHLLIDWREGERWYWDTLVDADYGNNSVNWQWSAGTGVDSNQWSRILAPIVQSEKFDAAGYIREWVPELRDVPDKAIHDPHGAGCAPADYPEPLIGHKEGRERALAAGRAVRDA